ncbi:hypothetical protein MKZ38_003969 [Zalerion maritima]|uniref:Uncharacterized protein n=1 Tax=Zalerion maritima TaxID=339359 RepID=A0AAD5RLX9_9PEZI|nr:hypothetical protein MKZ38_003969 [Zalerion maritima]
MASNFYSQAFNFNKLLERGVDPRTGQYTCALSIFECPSETRNCPPLNLSIYYSPLNTQDIGLGRGWGFNVTQYQHRGSDNCRLSLAIGDHYRVTELSDNVIVNDKKLENFIFKKKTVQRADSGNDENFYEVVYKSGQVEILSNEGDSFDTSVPVLIYATNGRQLTLAWTAFGEQPRLTKIQDGGQDLLEISYTDAGAEIVRNPGTSESSTFSLLRTNDLLTEIRLPLEEGGTEQSAWQFSYEAANDEVSGFSTVTSPAGLVEQLQYGQEGHRLPDGALSCTIPYVARHTVFPGQGQPAIETSYQFSDHNFLGYGGCVEWKDGEDNLYLVPDDYQYTSTVKVTGGSTTTHVYNKFHLVVESQKQKGTNRVTQSIEYYALRSTPFDEQPAQYQLPRTVTTTFEDTSSKKSRSQVTQHEFDEWGNPTKEVAPSGIITKRVYYATTGEKDATTGDVHCPADPHGFQRYVKKVNMMPAASSFTTPTRSREYTYRELPAAAGGYTTHSVVVEKMKCREQLTLEDNQYVTSTEYTYIDQPETRDHGRLLKQASWVFGQYPMTRNWTYSYITAETMATTTKFTSFDNSTFQEESQNSLLSGLNLTHKDAAGLETRFEYDLLQRLVKVTTCVGTPYEAARRNQYDFSPGTAGYLTTVTDAKGVSTRTMTDGLERVCSVEKQDDDDQWGATKAYTGTYRVLQQLDYNQLGQCKQQVEIDWLRTSSGKPSEQRRSQQVEYDDWGHVCKVTDSNGLVTSQARDPIALTYTEGIEGEGESRTQFNLFGSPVQKVLLNTDNSIYSTSAYAYDGLNRLRETRDALGHVTQYEYDSFDRVVRTTRPDNHKIDTRYAPQSAAALPESIKMEKYTAGGQSFDGLDRPLSITVGGRTVTQSYEGITPKPWQITTPSGKTYSLAYESALDYTMTSLDTSDGVNIYTHDKQTGAILQFQNLVSSQELDYFPSGLVRQKSTRIKDSSVFSAQSGYSMDGKLQSYTDVHGLKQEIQYDSYGRPHQLVQGKLKVTYSYGRANRISAARVEDEENNLSVTTHLKYDDFGREIERAVQKGDKTFYTLSQTYGKSSLLAGRNLDDCDGRRLRHESFQYDSLDRLIDYQCDGSQSPADEHGNQLKRQQFTFDKFHNLSSVITSFQDGTDNTTRFYYQNKDQTQVTKVTNTHRSYPSQIDLAYNENGCLTRDERGRTLEYDDLDRLSTVRDAHNVVVCQYGYDASGKLVCQCVPGMPTTYLYYRSSTLIATTTGDCQVSYASDGSVYWGQTTQQKGKNAQRQLWASDSHQSIVACLDAQHSEVIQQQYEPYGFRAGDSSSIGFNGKWCDPVTGWYHLGNGYRVYNPVLRRFHTPDKLSPFGSGEINPYAYCLGDPINRVDPSGLWSIFGMQLGWRDVAIMGVGFGVGILVGILTGGAGFAIEAGVAIAAGVASDVTTGIVYDSASGKGPSWDHVGSDALYGLLGAIGGEAVGRTIAVGVKTAARRLAPKSVARFSKGVVRDVKVSEFHQRFPAQREIPLGVGNPGPVRGAPKEYPGLGSNINRRTQFGVHMRQDMNDFDEMFTTIMRYNQGSSKLQQVVSDIAYGSGPGRDLDELWYIASWHPSGGDALEHATFRLYKMNDTGDFVNVESYHLYRDGRSTARTRPDEHPTAIVVATTAEHPGRHHGGSHVTFDFCSSWYEAKHSVTDLEEPLAVWVFGIAVGVRAEYYHALPRGLPYLRKARLPFFVDVVEVRVILLGYIV